MKRKYQINRVTVVLAIAVAASGLAGCSASGPVETVVKADEARSDKPRLQAASSDADQIPELVEGNTEFAFDLYRELFNSEENLFYSPYSLSVALAMTYAGASGETEQQMAEALRFELPQAQLHPTFNVLDQALPGPGEDEETFHLRIVNALWGQQGHSFQESFLDTLAENYGAGLQVVDFQQAEAARQLINQWGSEQTENKIEELLPPGSVDGETALVLTNATYFQAAWLHPFAPGATHDGEFSLLSGERVAAPMMDQIAALGYAERPGVQAVELPYAGEELSMVVLLPQAGTFNTFAQDLDAESVNALLSDLTPTGVKLTLPKFRFDAEFELESALTELGMIDAFGSAANFSGMDGTRELFIDQVYHRATVDVDEAGTEATSASAVVMARKGELHPEQEVQVDRPFLFLIRDLETGAILFLGHVVNVVA